MSRSTDHSEGSPLKKPHAPRWLSAWDSLPLAAFLGFIAIFASNRSHFPPRIAVHFGPRGVPDRYQDAPGFFIEVATLAGGVWLMLWAIGAMFQWFAKDEAAPVVKVLEPIRACAATGMLIASTCLIFQAIRGGAFLGFGIALSLICVLTGVVAGLLRMPKDLRKKADSEVPSERYRWGLFYAAADDPRLLVSKRFGYGWTLNFAHGRAWAIVSLSLLMPLLFVLVFALAIR